MVSYLNVTLSALFVLCILETDCFHFQKMKKMRSDFTSFHSIEKQYYDNKITGRNDFRLAGTGNIEFDGKDDDKNKMKISYDENGAIQPRPAVAGGSLRTGTIEQGGQFCSFEIYACQRETQQLVAGHIAAWARAEIYCLKESGTFSLILNSICGRRVCHVVGWKVRFVSRQSF
jgi:hypothetical protein